MNKTGAVLLATVGFVTTGAGWGDRAPVARVLEVQGKAAVVESENFDRPAAVFGTVYTDERLVTAKGSRVTLVFRADGHLERIVAPGTYRVTPNGCRPKAGVERVAMPQQNLATIQKISKGTRGIVHGGVVMARSMAPPSGETGGPPPGEMPPVLDRSKIRPLFDATLLASKPTFSWPVVPRAKKYHLKLFFLGNQVWSANTEATEIQYSGEGPLIPAAMYWWELSATVDDKTLPVCDGSFRMASRSQREEAKAVKKLLTNPDPICLATAALWYGQNGMAPEAIAVNEQLVKLTPRAAIYWKLSELYYEVGREQEGRQAEAKAEKLKEKAEGEGWKAED